MYGLFLQGVEVMARIGIHDFERESPQRLLIDVNLALDDPGGADDLASVVDYDFVRREIAAHIATGQIALQETLCRLILDSCWARPSVVAALVSTRKPDVYPDTASVGCRMFKVRAGADRADVVLALGSPL
jgi:dihydroneopterin aldolase